MKLGGNFRKPIPVHINIYIQQVYVASTFQYYIVYVYQAVFPHSMTRLYISCVEISYHINICFYTFSNTFTLYLPSSTCICSLEFVWGSMWERNVICKNIHILVCVYVHKAKQNIICVLVMYTYWYLHIQIYLYLYSRS